MNTLEVGKKLVELCKQGKNDEATKTLYAQDIVSVEAGAPPGQSAESRGLEAIIAKGKWWAENHEVHSASCEGPYPHGDRFIVQFKYDVTNKPSNKRMQMDESALYTVQDGKIVREEFFYSMGD
ncbi:MAG: nuclear transport factor 2 family protein [Myxococcales bacterium]|nr:nuclear transport factor 2 family protein [Myxococcales bacterium]